VNGRNVKTSTGQNVNSEDALRVSGAVLAGGKSSRMGSPKHALPMRDGRMMIEHVVDALRSVCDEVLIVGPDEVLPALPHVHDRREDSGPLAGIEALLMRDTALSNAALQAAPKSTKGRVFCSGSSTSARHYLICPCDIPLITADLLQRLCIRTDKPITVFHIEGRNAPEPLPMRVSVDALSFVQQCLESTVRSIKELLNQVDFESVVITEAASGRLRNINAPTDFDALS